MALLCLAIANRDAAAAADAAAQAAAQAAGGGGRGGSARGALQAALRRFGGVATAAVGLTAAHWKHLSRRNTVQQARRNISAHYDLSNEMFATFLSADMTYSCALFDQPDEPLQAAQERKLRALADKARLSPGMHVLEIGFGWGSLTLLLASHYGVRVTGITLSEQQLALAQERVNAAGLAERVTFVLADYRVHVPASGERYDAIISCEMLEAVGHEFMPAYFTHCGRLLAPTGLLVVQVITTPEYRYDAYRDSTDFIKEYIFPGCCCPSLAAVLAAAGGAGLSLDSLADIGPHYAPTLLRWRQAFMAARPRLAALGFNDAFVRCWDYYFQYCAAGFATRTLGDLQLVFSGAGNVARLGNVPFVEEPAAPPPPLWWRQAAS
jgi:cyclopropane-fatty-acyl-phospholipid synthase